MAKTTQHETNVAQTEAVVTETESVETEPQIKRMTEIQAIRKSTGLSQSQFAKYFHLSRNTLQFWEQGENGTPASVLYLIKEILALEGRPFIAPDDNDIVIESSVNQRWKEDSILYLIKRLRELECPKNENQTGGNN